KIKAACPLSGVVDWNHEGVVQFGSSFCLKTEPFEMRFGPPMADSDDLYCNSAVQTLLSGTIHNTLSTAANLLQQLKIVGCIEQFCGLCGAGAVISCKILGVGAASGLCQNA